MGWKHIIRKHVRRTATAYVVLVISLALTAFAWYFQLQSSSVRREIAFTETVRAMQSDIRRRIETYVNALRNVSALFSASDSVQRDEFHAYIGSVGLFQRYPGIKGVGFIRRVRSHDLGAYVRNVRQDRTVTAAGYPDFNVFPRGARAEYHVVEFIEPFAENRDVFGFDQSSEAVRRLALERARDSGLPTATGRVNLIEAGGVELPGFLIMVPAYRKNAPIATAIQGRDALIGYTFGRFAAAGLLTGIFGANTNAAVHYEIYDGPERDRSRLIFDSAENTVLAAGEREHYRYSTTLEVAGRTWTLYFITRAAFQSRHELALSAATLLGGVLVSIFLFVITWMRSQTLVERKVQGNKLRFQATHDSLTGLPNRNLLYERMGNRLRSTESVHEILALLLIDLNGFKEINDTLGHHSGDKLLRYLRPRLQALFGPADTVARLGGDEFAVFLGALGDRAEATRAAERIVESISNPFDLNGLKIQIGASIGIALFPEHGRDTATLMRCADMAMYIAKKKQQRYLAYNSEFDQHTPHRLVLMTDLNAAIAEGHLFLQFQPIISVKGRSMVGVETLVRWRHPQHGVIPPDQFIPQAEHSELIKPLTSWVIDNALGQCRRWHDEGLGIKIAVNISARNLQDGEFAERVAALLAAHRLNAGVLQLEITESAIVLDPDRSLATLLELHAQGIHATVDDFGTGYSSLTYLKKLPVDTLKIDQSFVTDMRRDESDAAIVHSTIHLAHNLGLKAIAEGVESREVLDALESFGCDEAQGSFVSQPLSADQLAAWLRNQTKDPLEITT